MKTGLSPRERASQVRAMFARIVPRYDLMNRLMTGGQDARWRRTTVGLAQPLDAFILDLATGTGDVALELLRQGARGVVGADYSEPMLRAAAAKLAERGAAQISLLAADALALPFNEGTFDSITSAFLLRNVVDLPGALVEMRRVLRSGGRAVALELTHIRPGIRASLFEAYLQQVVPRLGGLIAGDSAAYRYLPTSLDPFPDAELLESMFREAGFGSVSYRLVGFGALAIHVGVKPDHEDAPRQ